MKNTDTKNKIKNLNTQEMNRKTLTQSPVRRVGIITLAPYQIDNGAFKLRIQPK